MSYQILSMKFVLSTIKGKTLKANSRFFGEFKIMLNSSRRCFSKEATPYIFIISRFLSVPLEVLFTLLIFILSKNIAISPFQLTLVACIKPMSALVSFYLSSLVF